MFLTPSNTLASGFLGVSVLVNLLGQQIGINIPVSFMIVALNLPVAILCAKGISVRFTLLSLLQISLTSFFIRFLTFEPIFDDLILNIIFGGVLNGVYILLALKGNASTGGTDFIALYVSNKSGRTIWEYVFLFNSMILMIYGYLFDWRYAGYSIILQYIATHTVSTFHTRYQLHKLQITTTRGAEIRQAYIDNFRHGITCIHVEGGYTKQERMMLITVVSSYEVDNVIRLLQSIDPYVIISISETQRFIGRFHRDPE